MRSLLHDSRRHPARHTCFAASLTRPCRTRPPRRLLGRARHSVSPTAWKASRESELARATNAGGMRRGRRGCMSGKGHSRTYRRGCGSLTETKPRAAHHVGLAGDWARGVTSPFAAPASGSPGSRSSGRPTRKSGSRRSPAIRVSARRSPGRVARRCVAPSTPYDSTRRPSRGCYAKGCRPAGFRERLEEPAGA
jgi:hypothetical protein